MQGRVAVHGARALRCGLVAALLSLGSCSASPEPVVVIGLDGLEWDVVLPLLREGRMPTLERLMRKGSFGRLSTRAPARSPVIWTTVVTGKEPVGHGILGFTRPDGRGGRRLYTNADRTTKALWNILDDHGQRSIVLGWWNTYPVEAVNGVMVAPLTSLQQIGDRQWIRHGGVERGTPGLVHPPERAAETLTIGEQVDRDLETLLEELFPAAAASSPRDLPKWEACRWSLRADETVRRTALRLLREETFPDLLLVYFATTDVVGHLFWRYHAPEAFRHPPSPARAGLLGGVVERAYEHVDGLLAELLAEMPADATVFVISDHGMRAKYPDLDYETVAEGEQERESGGHGGGPPGVLVAAGPLVHRAEVSRPLRELRRRDLPRIGDIADITPTVLALRGIPLGRDMNGSVLRRVLSPDATEAFRPDHVTSHDTAAWRAARPGPGMLQPGHDERLEQLRALGYLDEDGATLE